MVGLQHRTYCGSVIPAVLVTIVFASIVFLSAAELTAGVCDDCDAHCGANCDCLSCLPPLLMDLGPSHNLATTDMLVSWHMPSPDVHLDPPRVSGIEHPPRLSA